MIFDIYNQFGAINSKNVFKSFEIGLKKHGHQVEYHTGNGDVAVIWSVLWFGRMRNNQQVFDSYIQKGKSVIVLEIGNLIRDRTHDGKDIKATWKIGINGINLPNYFVQGKNNERFNQLRLKMAPWKNKGDHILICSQHERSEQWRAMPPSDIWVEEAIKGVRKYTDRPIRIRAHPRFPLRRTYNQYNSLISNQPFLSDLNTAWALVNHCSNPGIEAVMNGIPAFVSDVSLAAPVANTDYSMIEQPRRPDRTQWGNDLAWTEWTQQEMVQGIPQDLIFRKIKTY